ncbi:MAG: hypothetical protein HUU17_10270 [Chthonomonadales bacterium]|nr:hypothetical protein [Chthonomonadales bacterium]
MGVSNEHGYDDSARINAVRIALRRWYESHARDFPWRHNRTPYRTAIAELMLRRTRAEQVTPVYEAFIAAYPTLDAAAHEDSATIIERFRPLGLEWRARDAAAFIREAHAQYGRNLPADAEAVRRLPGAGDYVSSAIACFSDGKNQPLIDTNTVRVLGRVFGVRTDGEARRRKAMRSLAAAAVDPDDPARYHYALIDLAARICRPRNPRCSECPIASEAACRFASDNGV